MEEKLINNPLYRLQIYLKIHYLLTSKVGVENDAYQVGLCDLVAHLSTYDISEFPELNAYRPIDLDAQSYPWFKTHQERVDAVETAINSITDIVNMPINSFDDYNDHKHDYTWLKIVAFIGISTLAIMHLVELATK